MKPWLIMLMPYFGRWPVWMNFFVASCKTNPRIRWRFYTDCGEPENKALNIDYVQLSFGDYINLVRERLGSAFDPVDPYKLCDLRPCLGYIHREDVGDTPFFGFGDIDVVYGDIEKFYTPDLLRRYGMLTAHGKHIAGHFTILRNTNALRRIYRQIPDYGSLLAFRQYNRMDEVHLTRQLRPRNLMGRLRSRVRYGRSLFEERFSTIGSSKRWHDGTMDYPPRWYWQDGHLTNEQDKTREFLYLHFSRWRNDHEAKKNDPGDGAWQQLDRVVDVDWRRAETEGFCISPNGFTALEVVRDKP